MLDDLDEGDEDVPMLVNMDGPEQVRYWMRELGVDEAALREAVQLTGPYVPAVRAFVKSPTSIFV